MLLRTYRLNQIGGTNSWEKVQDKKVLIMDLWQVILHKDPNWHFFFDPGGGTLRFSPEFENRVVAWFKKKEGFTLRRRKSYVPWLDEYPDIKFLAKDLQPMFHELSVLSAKYPVYVLSKGVFDRLTHTMINQLGIHDFKIEANWLLETAYNRALLQQRILKLPKWVHELVLKVVVKFPKWKLA